MYIFSKYNFRKRAFTIIVSLALLSNTASALDKEITDYFFPRQVDAFNKFIVFEALPSPSQMMVPVILSAAESLLLYGGDEADVGAEMTFCEIKSYQLKIILSNSGEKPFSHPSHPSLKRYSDGVWQPYPVKDGGIAEVALLYSVGPGESKERTYDLSFYYGELPPGDYQAEMLISQYDLPYYEIPLKSRLLTCRFSISDEVHNIQ